MFFVGYAFYELGMSETELIGITGHATVRMVRHYIETSGDAAVIAAKRRIAAQNYARARIAPPEQLPVIDIAPPSSPTLQQTPPIIDAMPPERQSAAISYGDVELYADPARAAQVERILEHKGIDKDSALALEVIAKLLPDEEKARIIAVRDI